MKVKASVSWITRLYVFVITLYIFRVYDVTWLYFISASLVGSIICFVVIIKFILTKNRLLYKSKDITSVFLLLLYCFYSITITHLHDGFIVITFTAIFLSMTSVILLSREEKQYLLKVITNCFVIVLLVSLPFWILFLLGVNLPHSAPIQHPNGFHVYYDYYFFRISVRTVDALFPRFSSVFLEPGQLATPCVFLFFLNSLENKILSFKNIILLIAIIMSFSLIGFGLLLVSLVSIAWFRGSRFRYILTVFVLLVIGGFYNYFSSFEDNAVSALILSRIEYDKDEMIVGNNRTSYIFDMNYRSFLQSNDKYFGVHDQLKGNSNWASNSSGYKKFIVHHGIVGLTIFLLFIISLYWFNRNTKTTVFLLLLLTAFFVRDLLQNPMWMSMAIIGFSLLNPRNNTDVYGNSEVAI